MELGVADLGLTDIGMGEEQEQFEEAPMESTPVESVEGDVIAEEDGEAINMPVKDPDKPENDKPAVKPPKKTPPKISEPTVSKGFQDAMSNAWNKGGSSGTKPGKGDQGSPDGLPGGGGGGGGTGGGAGGDNGPGIGAYSGPGYDMSINRTPNVRPKFSNDHAEEGKVVLRFFVNREGKVTRVEQVLGESTTTSQNLVQRAKKSVLAMTFNPDPDAAPEQQGKISVRFVLN